MTKLGNFVWKRWRALLLLCNVCIALGVLGAVAIQKETEAMLFAEAQTAATVWSDHLTRNAPELGRLIAGRKVSDHTIAFLTHAKSTGPVKRFAIYDTSGNLRFSDGRIVRPTDPQSVLKVDNAPLQASSIVSGGLIARRVAHVSAAGSIAQFDVLAPLKSNGLVIGAVKVRVDQADRLDVFFKRSAQTTLVFSLLLAFVPCIGFWHRTRQKQQIERNLAFLTSHDALTGLPNREMFLETADSALKKGAKAASHTAVVLIDIDYFHNINDQLGHAGGDYVLRVLAQRLNNIAGVPHQVARLTGNRFGLLKQGIASPADATGLAEEIQAGLAEAIEWQEHVVEPTASIGIAMAPVDGKSAAELNNRADVALFVAKSSGRNQFRFFDQAAKQHFNNRRAMERRIAGACEHGHFELHYQPLLRLGTRKLAGFEALLRLRDPQAGLISPAECIPVAEDMRKIDEIGKWCLNEACRTAASWPEDLTVAVNLSPIQFDSGTLPEQVGEALAHAALPASRLELEVTEGLLLDDSQFIRDQLEQLQQMGIRIVLDDFGAGFSSLNYLWRFPFDKIKIDQAFTQAITKSKAARGILRTIISLGQNLNLPVTVEGVETVEQASYLVELECDLVQGFMFGKPMPASEIAAFVLTDFSNSLPGTASRFSTGPQTEPDPEAAMAQVASSISRLRAAAG